LVANPSTGRFAAGSAVHREASVKRLRDGYPVKLTPPPTMAGLSELERRVEWQKLVNEAEVEHTPARRKSVYFPVTRRRDASRGGAGRFLRFSFEVDQQKDPAARGAVCLYISSAHLEDLQHDYPSPRAAL
jgi:hypothetical protein